MKPSRSGNATENVISVRDLVGQQLVVVEITNRRIVMIIASGTAIGRQFRQNGNQFRRSNLESTACLETDSPSQWDHQVAILISILASCNLVAKCVPLFTERRMWNRKPRVDLLFFRTYAGYDKGFFSYLTNRSSFVSASRGRSKQPSSASSPSRILRESIDRPKPRRDETRDRGNVETIKICRQRVFESVSFAQKRAR